MRFSFKRKSKKRNKNENLRHSNFELMKCVSILFIVLGHMLIGILPSSGNLIKVINIILAFLLVHVNSFIIITGYFQCKKEFKITKLISINNATWFYTALIPLILLPFGIISLNSGDIVMNTLPINLDTGGYWFISTYLLLYLISPILNMVINNTDKKKLGKIILALVFGFMFLPNLTKGLFYNVNNGYSISNFIILYFIGAYFRLYPVKDSYFFKVFSKNARKLIYFSGFFFFAIINIMAYLISEQLLDLDGFCSVIGSIMYTNYFSYSNPILLLQTICFVLWFGEFEFKNRFFDIMASCSLGIYLIHNNKYLINTVIYPLLKICISITDVNFYIILITLGYSFLIFFICVIIELLRKKIFKFIYKRKFSCWLRKKYQNYFTSLGIIIK